MKEKQLQQKKKRILWGWILAVLLLSISMGTVNVQASKLKLNKTKITVYKGCTETLKVTGSKKKVKWSSSKKAVDVCFFFRKDKREKERNSRDLCTDWKTNFKM